MKISRLRSKSGLRPWWYTDGTQSHRRRPMKGYAAVRHKKLPQYPSWPDLSDQDVHQLISKQLAQLIPDTIQGYKCDQSTVCDVVLKASVEGDRKSTRLNYS